ncbi:glycosyltransferase family 4 protein [Carnobacterium gallinarum]|uniref:glycosyltransferase family 4 protein n=1 Tax=Carnobacterium gallinarum TaxID=2749 RepID=UPI000555AD4E|nr:glycosyltransferase family 4 protein [Carnobacterium gallinarum]
MIKVNMFSSADKVKGQGVGSAYLELIRLLKERANDEIEITINKYGKTQLSHYHTIDPQFYLTTFFKKRFGRRIGYVHFVPNTLKESIKLPKIFEKILYRYVVSFYKRMDHLVVVNPSFIPELVALGISEEKITYIPNFVAKSTFFAYSPEKIVELRKQHAIEDGQFVVFGAGQVQERKGVFDFAKLAEEMPDIKFIWAGGFSFGKITDGYERYKKLMDHPPKNLDFVGIIDRDQMVDYYNLTDVFLLPSYNELFPMCILEAFSTETPVLLRDLPLYRPVIDGYYAACEDREAMLREIRNLKENPANYQALKEQAIVGNNYYSEERLNTIWIDFYQKQALEGGNRWIERTNGR